VRWCRGATIFEAPLAAAAGPGVILTTYFTSRVDPLRCWKRQGGRLAVDSFDYIQASQVHAPPAQRSRRRS
jgi:hypothetical protein